MELKPHRTVLCVYEFMRFFYLIGAFLVLRPEGEAAFPWLALITPGALFLLIALFLRLNMFRYRAFCPLFMAGKGISILTTNFWLFFVKSDMIKGLFVHSAVVYIVIGIAVFLLLGDMLSVWLVNMIMKSKAGGGK